MSKGNYRERTRPVNGVHRGYQWRLYPTPEQDAALRRHAAMCVDLWNALMEICETRYRRGRQGRSFHCGDCAALFIPGRPIKLCARHRLPTEFDIGYWIR